MGKKTGKIHLSLKRKITISLSLIAVVLLISCIISVIEYRRMSNYVSSLIAGNVNSVNISQGMAESVNTFNLEILSVIGNESLDKLPDIDEELFLEQCEGLKPYLSVASLEPLADSVKFAFNDYMQISLELPDVVQSDFIDSRTWYFEKLQPQYNILCQEIDEMRAAFYADLNKNSIEFDAGLYRSIIPGIVSIGVGILLILMLLFFIQTDYVNPIFGMLSSLKNYNELNKKYQFEFDGDDQLSELNDAISELAADNQQLRVRLSKLKNNL